VSANDTDCDWRRTNRIGTNAFTQFISAIAELVGLLEQPKGRFEFGVGKRNVEARVGPHHERLGVLRLQCDAGLELFESLLADTQSFVGFLMQ